MGKWKTHPQVQFSGKSGVSYFEQLMMKRHRYDPMFLSRATHHLPNDGISSVGVDDRDLHTGEDTPSEYNIFYDPDMLDLHGMMEDHGNSDWPEASSCVKIEELDIGQSIASANPVDVRTKPNQLVEPELNPVKAAAKSGKTNAIKSATSTSKKQTHVHSSRSKSKSQSPNPETKTFHHALPTTSSKVSESDIQASVKKAWTHCSLQTQLSQFFLQGVEPNNATDGAAAVAKLPEVSMYVNPKLSSTIWLPDNSTSVTGRTDFQDIDPVTDLPPQMSKPKSQSQHSPCLSSKCSQSESGDEDSNDLTALVSNIEDGDVWERHERDEEDDEALECLAWELASTVECEGRLTRCESELGEDEAISIPPSPQQGDEGGFPLTDLTQVMSEFELYQQNVMDQDSD